MPRGRPVTSGDRARVAELHAAGKGRNEIAMETGLSAGSVTKIAAELGLSFDREPTRAALAARKVDLAAERAAVSALMLARAREALDQMDQPHLAFNFGGKDNTYEEHLLERPPTVDLKNLMAVAGMGMRGHLDREKFDAGDKDGTARGLLGDLGAALSAAAAALPAEGPAEGDES